MVKVGVGELRRNLAISVFVKHGLGDWGVNRDDLGLSYG
jgi:hypothetical protein